MAVGSDSSRMSVQEIDPRTPTPDILAHAVTQQKERNLDDYFIVDIDSHHSEGGSWKDILQYVEDPVLRHPEMVLAFFQAMRTTVERYFEGNYLADEEVASAITAAQGIPGASLEALERLDAAAYYRPDFALINGDELLERMQATFLTMGGLLDYDEPLTAAEVIDTSLVEQAMSCPAR